MNQPPFYTPAEAREILEDHHARLVRLRARFQLAWPWRGSLVPFLDAQIQHARQALARARQREAEAA